MNPKEDLLNIGDCIIFPAQHKYLGLILRSIDKTVEYTAYDFLKIGQWFDVRPDFSEFQRAGVLGRRVPSGVDFDQIADRSYLKTGQFAKLFDIISMDAIDLEKILPQLEVIQNISFSKANYPRTGSVGGAATIQDLQDGITWDIERVGEIDESSNIEQEVFSLEEILAIGPDIHPKEVKERWILSRKTAHPNAIRYFDEDFYWDGIDEFAPFGNDGGHDALYGFQQWRIENKNRPSADYIKVLENEWGMDFDHLYETEPSKIKSFHGEIKYFMPIDQQVIGVSFAQLVLEGKISKRLLQLGQFALKRQLHPDVMDLFEGLEEERKIKLQKLFDILEREKGNAEPGR